VPLGAAKFFNKATGTVAQNLPAARFLTTELGQRMAGWHSRTFDTLSTNGMQLLLCHKAFVLFVLGFSERKKMSELVDMS
jgi:hypothetical protein